jgi:uncharacterized protein (TIGR02452 family)
MMSQRSTRAQIARETLAILEEGRYRSPSGREVAVREAIEAAQARSVLHVPEQFEDVFRQRDRILLGREDRQPVRFEVTNETTLSAARRLIRGGEAARVLALNFASAKNPGGGFLNGSQAQEESLARASGLYACIAPLREMYDTNRRFPSCLYTDHMIYSPDVPVFRDDADELLEQPYAVSFLTAPAVNAGAVRANEPHNVARIGEVMPSRIEKVLSLAVLHGHDALVLGAWGCGVFGNDPDRVAEWFSLYLNGEGRFRSAFRTVTFAVLDRTSEGTTIGPFARRFGKTAC